MDFSFKLMYYVRRVTKTLVDQTDFKTVQLGTGFCGKMEEIVFVLIHFMFDPLVFMLHQTNKKTLSVTDINIAIYNSFPSQLRKLLLQSVQEKVELFHDTPLGSHTKRAQLIVPPSKCRKIFKVLASDQKTDGQPILRLKETSPVALATVVEVCIREIMRLVLKKANDLQLQRVTGDDLNNILTTNNELSSLVAFAYSWLGMTK